MNKLLVRSSEFVVMLFLFCILPTINNQLATHAIVDPLAVPNNKFGIHIISASIDEAKPASELVNSSGGDWGYITVLVESKDRDQNKWQKFFDDLRREHLIPLVRLATQPDAGKWKRPYDGEEQAWAGFLDNLVWPTKNRYVILYNEPNHATEWGGNTDPKNYAETINKTIDALRKKSEDFYILNAGFDTAAPNQPPNYMDQLVFMTEMDKAVPGIFNKLDGWSSHSYPFAFVGDPGSTGRGTPRTWLWEMQALRSLGVGKDLPIFITETGWKHAEGLTYDRSLPSAFTVSGYFENAFKNAWTSSKIVTVTPFLLSYQDPPFDHFSFKKTGDQGYYDSYSKIAEIPKLTGYPLQEEEAELTKGEIYKALVAEQLYNIPITFKNTGQSIWNERTAVILKALEGAKELNIEPAKIPDGTKVEPGQEYTFNLKLKAPVDGQYKIKLALFNQTWDFHTEIKTPVILKIAAKLKWKKDFKGDYILSIRGASGDTSKGITLSSEGLSKELEARYLLPGYKFKFTLSKPYYKDVTIERPVNSGLNTLNFGTMEPDFGSTIFNPVQFWKLLPFSK